MSALPCFKILVAR